MSNAIEFDPATGLPVVGSVREPAAPALATAAAAAAAAADAPVNVAVEFVDRHAGARPRPARHTRLTSAERSASESESESASAVAGGVSASAAEKLAELARHESARDAAAAERGSAVGVADVEEALAAAAGDAADDAADADDETELEFVAIEWEDGGAASTLRGLSRPSKSEASTPRDVGHAASPRAAARAADKEKEKEKERDAGELAKTRLEAEALPPKEVSKGEQDFARKLLESSGDQVLHMRWVSKINPRGDVQPRLLVVGLYRVYSIKRRWNGKKEVRRDGHLADLQEIFTDAANHCKLSFTRDYMKDPFVIDVVGEAVGTEVPREIARALHRWAYDLPARKMPRFVAQRELSDEEQRSLSFKAPSPPPDSLGGFVPMYRAMCNYNALPVSEQVLRFIENLGPKRTTFWLNRCSKVRHPNIVPMKPVVAALKFNRHFRAVMLTKTRRPAVLSAMAVAVSSNQWLRRIIVSGCGVRSEGAVLLGRALKQQRKSSLAHIDVSRNPIGDRGMLGIIDGLRAKRYPLHVLRVANCSLTHKSLAVLFFAFTDVGDGVLTSQTHEIDISENSGGVITTNAIINWLRVGATGVGDGASMRASAKRHPMSVRRLGVAMCKLEIARLVEALRSAPLLDSLERLRCGGGKLDMDGATAMRHLLASAPKLSVCDVHNSSLDGPQAVELLSGVLGSEHFGTGSVEVDLSENPLGVAGAKHLLSLLTKTDRIGSLNVRLTKMTSVGIVTLLDGLAAPSSSCLRGLEELMLAFDDVKKPSAAPAATAEALKRLPALVNAKESVLRNLVLFGDGDKQHLGKLLIPFITELAKSKSPLRYLDVSSHLIGDQGAEALAALVRETLTLQTLVLDDNHITANGFQLILNALKDNLSLCNMPYPKRDVRRACASSKTGGKKVHAVLMEIKQLLKRNRKRADISIVWVGDDESDDSDDGDDSDEETATAPDADDDAAEPHDQSLLGQATLRGRGSGKMASLAESN